MTDLATRGADGFAPSVLADGLADARGGRPAPSCALGRAPRDRGCFDFESLDRVTLGDAGMEREVLLLFARQAELLLARMRLVPPAAVPALAHVLKVSARGIGAREVARAAQAVELADGIAAEAQAAQAALTAAVERTRAAIAELLRVS